MHVVREYFESVGRIEPENMNVVVHVRNKRGMCAEPDVDERFARLGGGLDIVRDEQGEVSHAVHFPYDIVTGQNAFQQFVETFQAGRKVMSVHSDLLMLHGPARIRDAG